ncbi:MAG: REP-associated tyrosine transposase [Candidatus Promineifilaceae bacterium]
MSLKRIEIEGHIYYLTTVVQGRLPIFTGPSFIIPLLDSLNYYRYRYRFFLIGYVIMPDHLHLLIWPHGQSSISVIMRDFKKFTAVRLIRQATVEQRQDLLAAFEQAGEKSGRSIHKVWQDSFWDKIIYSEKFLRQKLNYLHRNPCRAELVVDPADYPYSSYRNYMEDDSTLINVDKNWY